MRKRQHAFQVDSGDDQETVAIAAAGILAASSPGLPPSEDDAARPRAEMDAQLSADGASIAAIRGDLAKVHDQLDQVTAGVVALQTHSLRQTGGVALALSVLIAIGWKVIAG